MRRQFLLTNAALLAAIALPSTILGKNKWPDTPITTVVPYPAGGGTDGLARIMGKYLEPALNTAVIVENRAGATGTIGTAHVSRSRPDGNTLLYGFLPTLILAELTNPDVTYRVQKDFSPICRLVTYSFMLVAEPDFEADTIQEVLKLAHSSEKPLMYATHGIGSPTHLSMEHIGNLRNIKFDHVPYKGEQPMVADLLGQHISMGWLTVNVAIPLIRSGKVKPLVIGSSDKVADLPDTPTLEEVGLSEASFQNWAGLLAPAGVSAEKIDTLMTTIQGVLQQPELVEKLKQAGFTPDYLGPNDFRTFLEGEAERYRERVSIANLGMK